MSYITWISIVVMLCGLTYEGVRMYRILEEDPFADCDASQHAISYGVLGTFLGITIGLYQFNSNDLQNSVPILLEGMKTAFITSVLGMLASIGFKKYQEGIINKNKTEDTISIKDVTLDNILEHLIEKQKSDTNYQNNLLESIQTSNYIIGETIRNSLEKLAHSLVGDNESTVIGQLKFMRTEFRDSRLELIEEFRTFAKQMAENNSKAFIQALNESMRDLNNQLQEQFGENFNQLNIAVGKLLEWQEHYKNTVIEVTETQKLIFSGLEKARTSLDKMASSSSSIQDSAENLSSIVVTLSSYQTTILATLDELGRVAANAKEVIPTIDLLHHNVQEAISKNYILSTETIKIQASAIHDLINHSSEDMTKMTSEQLSNMNLLSKETQKTLTSSISYAQKQLYLNLNEAISSLNQFEKTLNEFHVNQSLAISDSSEKQINNIERASAKLQDSGLLITKRVSDSILNMVETNNENLKNAVSNIDNALDKKINDSLNSLGQQLVSISSKFVYDYSKLSDKLKELSITIEKIK